MLYLKKSKIVLLFKIITCGCLVLAIFTVSNFIHKYKFYKDASFDKGIITMLSDKGDYIVVNIKSHHKNYKAYIKIENDLDFGDEISFKYVNKEVYKNTIPNTYNYKEYLKSKNINQVIIIESYKKIRSNWYYKFKGTIYKKILKRKSRNYIFTFLCGDKSYLDNDVKMSYMNNGISHLLCVSGFHVVFIFSMIIDILRHFIKSEKVILFILMIFALFYLILTSFMIALFRAIFMYFFAHINRGKTKQIPSIYYFLFTLAISLVFWPNIIYDIGFYYTYVLTFFLIASNFKLNNLIKVTLFCFIISAPITIYLNYNLNFLSFIFGVLASYVVCYLLYPLCFLAIFSNILDCILYKLSYYFETMNLYLNNINIFKIVIPKISIFIVIIIYVIYLIYILKQNKICIYLYFLIFLYMLFSKYFDDSIYVYFIDVRQGDMSVIISKNFKTVTVIDTGGIVDEKFLKNSTKQFLYSVGVKKINTLILTHGDYDHMGEAINLVNNFKVEKVIFNCGEFNDLEKELIKVLDKKKIEYQSCINKLDNLYFLNTKKYNNENDNSNVIYTEINRYKFLFMGDSGVEKEKDILDKFNVSNIDVLKVGHHGSKTSSRKEFIDKIDPKYSIISVGKNNRYGHPNKEVLDNLKESKIYRTDQDGSIMFKIKNNKLKIETCSP